MKWIITFLAVAALTIACEKSAVVENENGSVAAATSRATGLVGTWVLVQYYEDRGDGTGVWKTPDFVETISFGSEGQFSSSSTFPLYPRGYTGYVAKESVIAFSPATGTNGDDVYSYSLENSVLTFNPRCRETCTRRYARR
jgi:hypothetical protein